MEPLAEYGLRLKRAPAKFEHVRDIEVLDGPVVSEFLADSRDRYLFIWRDSDSEHSRWLAVPTRTRDIAMYESRLVSLRDLVQRAVSSFLFDLDATGKFARYYVAAIEHLPEKYIPQQKSFFDPDLRPTAHVDEHQRGQQILIEGQWTLNEIAQYPRRFEDVYAVQCLLSSSANAPIRQETPFNYTFKSGYVYHNFWAALTKGVPKEHRPRMDAVQYSSPGIIQYSLNEDIATKVVRDVRRLERKLDLVDEIYRSIHRWLKAQKRDKAKPGDKEVLSKLAVQKALKTLCQEVGTIDYDKVQALTKDLVNTAEIVLSYYRRLRTLAQYEILGRATLVSVDPDLPAPAREADLVAVDVDDEAQDEG